MTWQRIFSKELLIVLSTLNDVIYGLQMDFPSSWAHEPVCIHDGLFAAQVKYCHCGLSHTSPPLPHGNIIEQHRHILRAIREPPLSAFVTGT